MTEYPINGKLPIVETNKYTKFYDVFMVRSKFPLRLTTLSVLGVIYSRSRLTNKVCSASLRKIADESGLASVTAVMTNIGLLLKEGYIEIVDNGLVRDDKRFQPRHYAPTNKTRDLIDESGSLYIPVFRDVACYYHDPYIALLFGLIWKQCGGKKDLSYFDWTLEDISKKIGLKRLGDVSKRLRLLRDDGFILSIGTKGRGKAPRIYKIANCLLEKPESKHDDVPF